jgi:hypothetical protein
MVTIVGMFSRGDKSNICLLSCYAGNSDAESVRLGSSSENYFFFQLLKTNDNGSELLQ